MERWTDLFNKDKTYGGLHFERNRSHELGVSLQERITELGVNLQERIPESPEEMCRSANKWNIFTMKKYQWNIAVSKEYPQRKSVQHEDDKCSTHDEEPSDAMIVMCNYNWQWTHGIFMYQEDIPHNKQSILIAPIAIEWTTRKTHIEYKNSCSHILLPSGSF